MIRRTGWRGQGRARPPRRALHLWAAHNQRFAFDIFTPDRWRAVCALLPEGWPSRPVRVRSGGALFGAPATQRLGLLFEDRRRNSAQTQSSRRLVAASVVGPLPVHPKTHPYAPANAPWPPLVASRLHLLPQPAFGKRGRASFATLACPVLAAFPRSLFAPLRRSHIRTFFCGHCLDPSFMDPPVRCSKADVQ